MLKLHYKPQFFLIATACCIVVIGCESPPESQSDSTIHDWRTTIDQSSNSKIDSAIHEEQPLDLKQLKQRLLAAYATHWPLIPAEYQHEQLPEVLGDPMPELRVFGIERVAVLLRDGEATEEELQLVVDRLRDNNPTVRLAVAKLLPEINVLGLPEYVANALSSESNEQVATLELSFFQTQPHPSALEPTIDRISTGPVEPAAKALIVLLKTISVTNKDAKQIVRIVQRARLMNNVPSLITLEAMLGDSTVQQNLVHLLHNTDESIRIATAQGFSSAGYAEPLIRLANDPTMYAFALTALQKRGGINAFKELINLYIAQSPQWNSACFAISVSLDTGSLLRADDMLRRLGVHELRLSILESIWEKTNRGIPAKRAIARRAVPLMIKMGDAVGALQLLDTFDESLVDEDLLSLRFSAAIAASAWDAAEDARPEPQAWITAWEIKKDADPTVATVIHQQIVQRFGEQLTKPQRALLDIEPIEDFDTNQTP